jgi:ribonuclease-3
MPAKAQGGGSAEQGGVGKGVGGLLAGMFGGMKNPWRALERDIGYRFRDRALLRTAFMHRSYRFENAGVDDDNQRLEFLGDAALNLAAAAFLFNSASGRSEGELTAMRSRLTSGKTLAKVARGLDLGKYLQVGKGEDVTGGRGRDSTLEDAFEAVMGAVYLDGGFKGVLGVFERVLMPHAAMAQDVWTDNPKGELQEFCQRMFRINPRYRLANRTGLPHDSVFVAEVVVDGDRSAQGQGRNKQEAERSAAAVMLARMREECPADQVVDRKG